MQASQRWLILAVISSALLLIVIDMTVLYTALPTLTHDLRASASEKLWIVNAYALVVSGLLLGTGTLGDRVGHKRLFVGGLIVFGVASLWAAFSPTPASLIAARALLAVGAAMMMPSTLSLIRLTFTDGRERALAIGIWASVASGGAAFGPVIGGVLLEHFWWGSVFLINVPIVLLALWLAWTRIPDHPGDAARRWDWLGSLQAMVGLIGLAYAIKELGKPVPALMDALLAGLLGSGVLWWFFSRQRRSASPMIELAIFRRRSFTAAVIAALVAAIALIGMELVYMQRLQLVLGLSPLQASLFILPLPLAAFLAGPVAGRLLPRVGSGRMLSSALAVSAAGMAACLLGHGGGPLAQGVALAILGTGLGATMAAASSTIMERAPAERAGMAASIEEVSYELGGAIGVTLMGSLLSAVYAARFVVPVGLEAPASVQESLDDALLAAEGLAPELADNLVMAARTAFDQGYVAVLWLATLLLGAAALYVMRSGDEAE